MTSTELNNATPMALSMRLAEDGNRRQLINGNSNATDIQSSIRFGFPLKMGQPLDTTGIPVTRQDMNQIMNTLSQLHYFMMAGGSIAWSISEMNAIGGYANGAVVWHQNKQWKSLSDNNFTEPGTDNGKWIELNAIGFERIYPVGSIFIGTTQECPLQALFGTWERIEGRYLLSSGQVVGGASQETFNAGDEVSPGLPNITGVADFVRVGLGNGTGAIERAGSFIYYDTPTSYTMGGYDKFSFNAQRSSNLYGNSTTVRPPAFVINVWRRTA